MPWEECFDLLKQFKKRKGHCNFPIVHKEDGNKLGIWVLYQRQRKRMEKIDPYRQKMLEDSCLEWVLVERRTSVPWKGICSLLKQFKKREGHCNVLQSHKEDGANLGGWVISQYDLKKKWKLDIDRDTRLEEVGPEWDSRYKV